MVNIMDALCGQLIDSDFEPTVKMCPNLKHGMDGGWMDGVVGLLGLF